MRTLFAVALALAVMATPRTGASQTTPRNQKLVAWRFCDDSAGVTRCTVYPIVNTASAIAESLQVTSLMTGSRRLRVSFLSSDSLWGPDAVVNETAPAKYRGGSLAYAEYFINVDPGRGKGHPLTLWAGTKVDTTLYKTLKLGDAVYVRFRDDFGRWSEAASWKVNYHAIVNGWFSYKAVNANCTPTSWTTHRPMTVFPHPDSTVWDYVAYNTYSMGLGSQVYPESIYVWFQSDDFIVGDSLRYGRRTSTCPTGVGDALVLATLDGQPVGDGAFVPTHPALELALQGTAVAPAGCSLTLDGAPVPGADLHAAGSGLEWSPTLSEGPHLLTLSLVSASGTASGTRTLHLTATDHLRLLAPRVSPNPSRGAARLSFTLTRPATFEVEIYDVSGRRVFRSEPQHGRTDANAFTWPDPATTSRVASGLYYYVLTARAGSESVSARGSLMHLN